MYILAVHQSVEEVYGVLGPDGMGRQLSGLVVGVNQIRGIAILLHEYLVNYIYNYISIYFPSHLPHY